MALTDPIIQFQKERASVPFQPPTLCTAETFPLLLAGVPALRKIPGLAALEDAGEAYFTSVPFCLSREDRQAARDHLEQVYGITDKDSMVAFCKEALLTNHEYLDFESFWDGRPSFSLEDLSPDARPVFQRLSDFARQFQPLVGRRGFLAWDISETLGHLRTACACELISMEEYREMSQYWVEQAAAFHSWEEYAVGLVCGAAYWAFRMGGDRGQQDAAAYLELNLRLVRQLLDSKQAWAGRMWYRIPQEKPFLLSAPELRMLLPGWEGPNGCLATDHITVLGKPVGWCYRERPDGQYPTRTSSPCSAPPSAPPMPGERTENSTRSPLKRRRGPEHSAHTNAEPHTVRPCIPRPTTPPNTERMTFHDPTGTEIRLQPQPEARPHLYGGG